MEEKKITTIGELGELLQSHMRESAKRHGVLQAQLTRQHGENRESFKSIGDHSNVVEDRLEQMPTRSEVAEMIERAYNVAGLKAELDLVRRNIREKLHVEV